MNTFSRLILLTLFGLTFGCKSITGNLFNNNKPYRVEITTVGLEDTSLFNGTFNSIGYIKLSSPIKLEATPVPFTKSSYKDFLAAKWSQSSGLDITYVDSLKHKPKHLIIKVADVLKLIDQLHEPSNENVKSYLGTNQRAGVVTELSIAFPKPLTDEILKAGSLFLAQTADATYEFQLIQSNGDIKTISYNEGIIMDYALSRPCWKSSGQNNYKVVELLISGDKCSSGAYRSPRFIKIKEDYFKFQE